MEPLGQTDAKTLDWSKRSKPRNRGAQGEILLKMNTGEAWFVSSEVNGIPMDFLVDTGAAKSVMSYKRYMSIPDNKRPKLQKT